MSGVVEYQALRIGAKTVWGQTSIGKRELMTTGIYRIVRHPIYLGNILYPPGLPVILGATWALLFSIFFSWTLYDSCFPRGKRIGEGVWRGI